jgi:hypothetical protein
MNTELAAKIAEEYVRRLSANLEFEVILFGKRTIEREFGWVFFYGPRDASIIVAGNAPVIIDRKDGSVHETGTAYPTGQYLESYARVGRPYPFAVPEHVSTLTGWKPGVLKVSLTKLIRRATARTLAEAHRCTDEVLAGKSVDLTFPTAASADLFVITARQLGALARRDTRFR